MSRHVAELLAPPNRWRWLAPDISVSAHIGQYRPAPNPVNV